MIASGKAFERGDTAAALLLIEKALQKDSTQAFLHEMRGFYLYTQGRDAEALAAYQRALELGGASPMLHYRIGAAYLTQRRWDEAYRHLSRSLSADSSNPDTWTALGLWAYSQGNRKTAESYWTEALRRDSTHEKARTFLYDLYLNDYNQPEIAKSRYLDPYWKLNRFDPLLNFQLGNYFLKKLETARSAGQPEKIWGGTYGQQAIQAYSQAILAYPAHAQAHYNRGYIYFLTRRYDKALEDFIRAAELNPRDARAWFMQGSIYELRGETILAQQAYQRALERDPNFKEARQALDELTPRVSSKSPSLGR